MKLKKIIAMTPSFNQTQSPPPTYTPTETRARLAKLHRCHDNGRPVPRELQWRSRRRYRQRRASSGRQGRPPTQEDAGARALIVGRVYRPVVIASALLVISDGGGVTVKQRVRCLNMVIG